MTNPRMDVALSGSLRSSVRREASEADLLSRGHFGPWICKQRGPTLRVGTAYRKAGTQRWVFLFGQIKLHRKLPAS